MEHVYDKKKKKNHFTFLLYFPKPYPTIEFNLHNNFVWCFLS